MRATCAADLWRADAHVLMRLRRLDRERVPILRPFKSRCAVSLGFANVRLARGGGLKT